MAQRTRPKHRHEEHYITKYDILKITGIDIDDMLDAMAILEDEHDGFIFEIEIE